MPRGENKKWRISSFTDYSSPSHGNFVLLLSFPPKIPRLYLRILLGPSILRAYH